MVIEEYIQFENKHRFDPIQLECGLDDAHLLMTGRQSNIIGIPNSQGVGMFQLCH